MHLDLWKDSIFFSRYCCCFLLNYVWGLFISVLPLFVDWFVYFNIFYSPAKQSVPGNTRIILADGWLVSLSHKMILKLVVQMPPSAFEKIIFWFCIYTEQIVLLFNFIMNFYLEHNLKNFHLQLNDDCNQLTVSFNTVTQNWKSSRLYLDSSGFIIRWLVGVLITYSQSCISKDVGRFISFVMPYFRPTVKFSHWLKALSLTESSITDWKLYHWLKAFAQKVWLHMFMQNINIHITWDRIMCLCWNDIIMTFE